MIDYNKVKDGWLATSHYVALTGDDIMNLATIIGGLQYYVDNVMSLRNAGRDEWVIKISEARKVIEKAQETTIKDYARAHA